MVHNRINRGIYAPDYYNEFKCTADKCKHSCCVDWGICIDEETLEKYKKLGNIMDTVTEGEDGACFVLTEDGRCPHLNSSGLCNIILSHGEEYLSEICEKHPRFFNYVSNERIEAGLGIVCEEACRLILENEKSFLLSKVEEIEADTEFFETEFNPLPYRDKIISIIETPTGGFDEKLAVLQEEFDIFEIYTPDEWLDKFLLLETLDAEWPQLLKSLKENNISSDSNAYEKYYGRLLIYFVYRHVSAAEGMDNLRARLAFAILSVQVIRRLFESETEQSLEKLIDYARRYSAEIEYSDENTDEIIFEWESVL